MSIINTPVSDSTEKIINPIAEQITHSVLNMLGLLTVFGSNVYFQNETSTGSNYKIGGKQKVSTNRCDVEILINRNPTANTFQTQTAKDEETRFSARRRIIDTDHILLDPVSGIYLHEASIPCSVDINFTFKVKTITEMDSIAAKLDSVFGSSVDTYHNHSIRLSYPMPDRVLLLLFKLFKLKTHSNPTNATFQDYLYELSSGLITYEVNRDNPNDATIVIAKEAIQIVGKTNNSLERYETDNVNKVVDRFVHTFTYQFVFSRPTVMNLEFPIVIDGAYVPQEYIHKSQIQELESLDTRRSATSYGYAHQLQRVVSLSLSYPWLRFPDVDEWEGCTVNFPKFKDKFLPRFSGICEVDVNKNIAISVINEIFPVLGVLDEIVMDAFAVTEIEEYNKLEALYQLLLFSNDHMVTPSSTILDSDLDFTYENADPTRVYRLLLVQQKDITMINSKYFPHLWKYADYYADFIWSHLPYLVTNNYLEVVSVDGPDQYGLLPTTGGLEHIGTSNKFGPSIIIHNYTLIPRRIK